MRADRRAGQAGCRRCYLIEATTSATLACSSLDSGEEPAASAATFWPSARGDVADVGLDELGLVGVSVLRADDRVAHEHQRVVRRVGRGALELDGEVVGLAALDGGRVVDDGCCALGARCDELVADLDLHDTEVTGARGVGVADGVGAVGDGVDDTRGALGALTGLVRERVGRLLVPHVGGDLVEVVREVLRGARVVRAVHGGDVGVGQGHAVVEGGDGRVVPLRDVALEDVGDGRGVERELVDTLDVEDDGDRGDVDREVDGLGVGSAGGEGAGDLLVVQGGVGAGEVDATGDEGLTTGAGARRVVVDGHVGVGGLEAGDPGLLGGLLRRGAGGVERAGERRGGLGRCGGCILVCCARGQCDGGYDGQDDRGAKTLEFHEGPFQGK